MHPQEPAHPAPSPPPRPRAGRRQTPAAISPEGAAYPKPMTVSSSLWPPRVELRPKEKRGSLEALQVLPLGPQTQVRFRERAGSRLLGRQVPPSDPQLVAHPGMPLGSRLPAAGGEVETPAPASTRPSPAAHRALEETRPVSRPGEQAQCHPRWQAQVSLAGEATAASPPSHPELSQCECEHHPQGSCHLAPGDKVPLVLNQCPLVVSLELSKAGMTPASD